MHESSLSQDAEKDFYVVGIGASAGGLEALESLFAVMPTDTGMAFVIVQHLSPDFKSLMDELLARHTDMAIHCVTDGMVVEPNSLYLIPPGQDMVILDGKLRLTAKDRTRSLSLPIDNFFRSLAHDCRSRAIAVILSGTGSDGSRGLCDVHESGGLVISQSVDSAKFDGMPRSAINTHLVDLVVAPTEIAESLLRYARHPIRAELALPPLQESTLEHIFRLLQERHQIDFNYYKTATISRRIQRRMQLNGNLSMESYAACLDQNPEEVDQLYRDLLIGVTQLFRDTEAFDSLREKVLPALLTLEGSEGDFRVWVAGCGSGEEAYSIAITIDLAMRECDVKRAVKIFATDVHPASIETAHNGFFPEASLEAVSPEIIDRYFVRSDGGYRVTTAIRKQIVFAPHNLVKDAPFTRLDLVTCRNMLIYFRPIAQRRAIGMFHFGLRPGGVMFLGASENPGELAEEFQVLDERWKLYRKIRDLRLAADFEGTSHHTIPRATFAESSKMSREIKSSSNNDLIRSYDELLAEHMPPAVLVDEQTEILHLFGGAGRFVTMQDGRPKSRLSELPDQAFRTAVLVAIKRAKLSQEPVSVPPLSMLTSSGPQSVRLQVQLLKHSVRSPHYLVKFLVAEPKTDATEPSVEIPATSGQGLSPHDLIAVEHFTHLELELRQTKESLQSTIEALETSNEELQTINEEMVASNEELQSTNEELHSVNEELYTVNAEYQNKIGELTELTNDMNNLLASTEVHTLFLDKELCVRKFTPKMSDVFNLVDHDIGRRIKSFRHSIQSCDLMAAVEGVIKTGRPIEEEVSDSNGHPFLMRVLPYTVDQHVDGAVLTLIDIASLAEARTLVVQERERFSRAIAANRDGTWDWMDVRKDEMWWSPNCYTFLGFEPDEFPATHSAWLSLVHPDEREQINRTSIPGHDRCMVELHHDFEYRLMTKSGEYRWFRHRAIVDYDESGNVLRITGSVADIHDRKVSEMQSQAIQRRDNFLAMLSHELRNPVGAILNAIQVFEFKESPSSSASQEYQIIARQSRHIARLLDDLLDVARFGQDRLEFRKTVCNLGDLCREAIEATAYHFHHKNHVLTVSVEDASLLAEVDPARIKQAQVNLLTNAAKYTPDEGHIFYRVFRDGDEAVMTIEDSGDGIVPDMIDSVFDMFVQSESTLARSSGGMGVGLSLAKCIVDAHGGKISAASEGEGKGSTFEVRLPLSKNVAEPPKLAPVPTAQSCRVILVEDNEDARVMLAELLRLQGHEVLEAPDGPTALRIIPETNPDIAVIDIGLPEMNGYQVAERIRQLALPSPMRLVALTGYGTASDREQTTKAGFDSHLVKPLLLDELLAELPTTKR